MRSLWIRLKQMIVGRPWWELNNIPLPPPAIYNLLLPEEWYEEELQFQVMSDELGDYDEQWATWVSMMPHQ